MILGMIGVDTRGEGGEGGERGEEGEGAASSSFHARGWHSTKFVANKTKT